MSPDRGIDNISPFYFTVMYATRRSNPRLAEPWLVLFCYPHVCALPWTRGTCLSFVLVFKSNIAYNRYATQG